MVLDFSLEKAAGSVITAHSISGIVNEITYFSGGIRWHIQIAYTFYWAVAEHFEM